MVFQALEWVGSFRTLPHGTVKILRKMNKSSPRVLFRRT